MSDLPSRLHLLRPHNILNKIKGYSQKAGKLGRRVRKLVFGFRLRSTIDIDRWSLPVKLQRHRILQRRRAFQQGGGARSSMAEHALNKARHFRPRP